MERNSPRIPQSPSTAPPIQNIEELEERVAEAKADGKISFDDAQQILDATDPAEKVSLAEVSNLIEARAAETLIDKIRSGLTDREWDMVQPHNERVRETVWRAMNPNAGPGATMPEDFDLASVSPEMKQKAEGFIRSRQDALRARDIAAILGDMVEGQKKPLPLKQREKMLEDLKGIIEDHEYRTLSIKLGKNVDGPSSPAGDTYGVTARLAQKAHEKQDQDNLTRWTDFEQTEKTAYNTATNNFYAKIGQERLSQEMALATAHINQDTTLTDAQKTALLAETKKEITKEIAVKTLLQSMRGTDMDFENMKQAQFLEYADDKEKTRFEKLRMACVGRWNKLPAPLRAAAGWTVSTPLKRRVTMAIAGAGVSTAVIALTPALTFAGITFFGAGWAATPAIFGGRAVRSGIAAIAGYPLHSFFQGRRKKSFEKTRTSIETEQTKKVNDEAQVKLDEGANWATLIETMQATQQETMERLNTLSDKEKSFINKLKWSAIPSLIIGTTLLAPRIADAAGAGLGADGKPYFGHDTHQGFGIPGEEYKFGRGSATGALPSAPRVAPADPLETPPPPQIEDPTGPTGRGAASTLDSEVQPKRPPATMGQAGAGATNLYKGESFWEHPIQGTIDRIKSAVGDLTTPSKARLPVASSAGATPPIETTPVTGGVHESLKTFSVKDAGSIEGALQKIGLNGGQAHIKVVEYIQSIKANQTSPEAMEFIARLKKAGYSGTQIDQALRDSTPKNYSNFFERAFRHMGKDGMVGYDPATQKMSLTEESFLKPRPTRPAVSHQPIARPTILKSPPPHPSATLLTPQEPAPPVIARGPVVPTIEYRPVGWAFSQEYPEIRDVKVSDFVSETNRLLQEQKAGNPLPSEILPHAYEAGQLDRYADMEEQIAAHAKKFKLTPEQMKNMRMDQLFVPKGGPRAIDAVPSAQPQASGQIRIRPGSEASNVDIPGT